MNSKSVWMDRWTATSSKQAEVDGGEGGAASNGKRLDINASPCNISEYMNSWRYQGEDIAVPHSTQGVQVLAEAKRVEITYETLAMNPILMESDSERVSVLKFSEKIGRILAQKRLPVSVGETIFQLKPFMSLDKVRLSTDKQLNDLSPNKRKVFTSTEPLPTQSCPVKLRRLEDLCSGCHSSSHVLLPKEPWIPDNNGRKIGVQDEWTTSSALKNESSAETDPMDINVCQTFNSFPSITSSASHKDTMVENSAKSHLPILRATLGSKTESELPDINQEPPSTLFLEKVKVAPSTSRTESLDAEHLHFDQAGNSSSPTQSLTMKADPSSNWVNRLKQSSSGSHVHGTKNVEIEIRGSSSTAKTDELCNKMSDHARNKLTSTFHELFGEADTMELDKMTLSLDNNNTSTASLKDSQNIKLSHPWIQRWCHNQAPISPTSRISAISPEVDCLKTASDDSQVKEEFPSIAAMALMGKAMNGLQACKFQNKGSFIVWGKGKS